MGFWCFHHPTNPFSPYARVSGLCDHRFSSYRMCLTEAPPLCHSDLVSGTFLVPSTVWASGLGGWKHGPSLFGGRRLLIFFQGNSCDPLGNVWSCNILVEQAYAPQLIMLNNVWFPLLPSFINNYSSYVIHMLKWCWYLQWAKGKKYYGKKKECQHGTCFQYKITRSTISPPLFLCSTLSFSLRWDFWEHIHITGGHLTELLECPWYDVLKMAFYFFDLVLNNPVISV